MKQSAQPQPITLRQPDDTAFAPFGRLIRPPDEAGRRAFYSEALQPQPRGTTPVMHVNHVLPSTLPLVTTGLERHPHASQVFVPLEVSRYLVLVAPSDSAGAPIMSRALGFVMPGSIGVIYAANVWHMGAAVLDRPGSFTVLMYRNGPLVDDEFRTIAPVRLIEPCNPAPTSSETIATEVSE